ncbi:winged helix-turn-helix domain-containing protein [Achromobacter mucicolens]|uniref:winged helix-turn-helix domain-containing protein n=1 Tax=Achromobacter mucicolens TaxID=1389922 RepID=UPI003D72B411
MNAPLPAPCLAKPCPPKPAGSLARPQPLASAAPGLSQDPVDGWWSLLYWGWTLQLPNGARVDLTELERACFACLVRNPQRELIRDEVKHLRGGLNMRSLNVAICRLRTKVRQAGARLPLRTVHGVGYAFLGNLRELANG